MNWRLARWISRGSINFPKHSQKLSRKKFPSQNKKLDGYKGYISIEVFEFDPDPQTIASRSIGYLKGILEALGERG
jgi:hypothetical protein